MGRTTERKAILIQAAQRAVAEHGAAVRLHHIAEVAGVTSSSVLYHYPNLDELLLAANQAGMERFHRERMAAIAGLDDPVDQLVLTISLGIPSDPEDEDVRLLCALGGEAPRNPIYAGLLTSLFERQVAMYAGILAEGADRGSFRLRHDVHDIARNLVALEDAYGYRIAAKHPSLDYAAARDLILEYARLATSHPLAPTSIVTPRRESRNPCLTVR